MNEKEIDLTIILLTFNHASSIKQAVESILEQETTYSYQIWLCDDCSTDGTTQICQDYSRDYPDQIVYFPQASNTLTDPEREFHLVTAVKNIKSKYFCLLEGDDQWCHREKIQVGLDIMEKNPEYILFAHDTLVRNIASDSTNYVIKGNNFGITNPVTFDNIQYTHTSARLYRNIVVYPEGMVFADLYMYYLFLDHGPLYYHDEVMSIYNKTGSGAWSTFSDRAVQRLLQAMQYAELNNFLGYRHDKFFTQKAGRQRHLILLKKVLGKKWGWKSWVYLRNFKYRDSLKEYRKMVKKYGLKKSN